ncbi:MAG: hypothetical protein GY832_28910 [Chloroflexi bacterium]|nr:hypothetical protein [Chloroflexota bacterium]
MTLPDRFDWESEDDTEVSEPILRVMRVLCSRLTDIEFAGFNTVAQLGENPRGIAGYEKLQPLFTEGNGTRVNKEMRKALLIIAQERFPELQDDE